MVNKILNNNALISLVNSLDIDEQKKSSIISNIPKMDEEERLNLLDSIKNVYFFDQEKAQAIEKIKSSWEQ